ncbi:regulatory protein RecX [Sphingobacterium bovistauri]|uniref:Regulatory protein RecX n=1 Tax=Sphingobacterium bovistauri TaxID=2781959 RepID=A0ABS7Z669_9SPHI|nr:regulatory protein RecX [Sphingobacterium bovistauri]MCA5005508.1 RecX family transcriptional regulator [Sphingobacterium bovistauri]
MDGYERNKKNYTPNQAKLKIESFCAYQERCQQEVRDKLYEWGLYETDVENIIANLISENFLNEERFAKAYVGGKFRMKDWGKIKIIQHLKLKKVSQPLIKIALREINDEEYIEKIKILINKKTFNQPHKLSYTAKAKLVRYLQSKGFENDLIFIHLKD